MELIINKLRLLNRFTVNVNHQLRRKATPSSCQLILRNNLFSRQQHPGSVFLREFAETQSLDMSGKPLSTSTGSVIQGHCENQKANASNITQDDNLVVCVEGNIGCGKTTLLEYFQNTSGCEVLTEPVDKWRNIEGYNALELMYKDPTRWSMALQTYVQLTMLQNHTKPMTHSVRLMERSIYSAKYCFLDNLLTSGVIPELEHIILTEWFDWIQQSQNIKVDLIVYLRTDPAVLHKRIMTRCREEEKGMPVEYLKRLHDLHEDWLIHKKQPCPDVLVLDANKTLEEMERVYEHHKNHIMKKREQNISIT